MKVQSPDYLSIEITPEQRLMYIIWLRNVTSQEYREGLDVVQKLLPIHDVKWLLTDSQKLNSVTMEDQQWLKNEIVPKLIQSELLKVARVVREDIFTYISFENLVKKAHKEHSLAIQIEQFSSVESALAWLTLPE